MKINYAVVGVFVLSAVLLFSIGLFLIGGTGTRLLLIMWTSLRN